METSSAPVVRSLQKDQNVIGQIRKHVNSSVLDISSPLLLVRYAPGIEAACLLLYYGATSISKRQSIGEEYTGLLQVDSSLRKIPSFKARVLMTALYCTSPLQKWIISRLTSRTNTSNIDVKTLLKHLPTVIDLVAAIHLSLFYIFGGYSDIPKLLAGIRYVAIRPWLAGSGARRAFQILGVVKLLQVLASTYLLLKAKSTSDTLCKAAPGDDVDVSNLQSCPLCLEPRRNSAAASCGHLFCWDCILQWLKTTEQCPVCREDIKSSRIVPIANF